MATGAEAEIDLIQRWARRRTGRTLFLLEEASKAASSGLSVLYVAPNFQQVRSAQSQFLGADMLPEDGGGTIQFESVSSVNSQRGREFDVVLLDDADHYEDEIPYIFPFARLSIIVMRQLDRVGSS